MEGRKTSIIYLQTICDPATQRCGNKRAHTPKTRTALTAFGCLARKVLSLQHQGAHALTWCLVSLDGRLLPGSQPIRCSPAARAQGCHVAWACGCTKQRMDPQTGEHTRISPARGTLRIKNHLAEKALASLRIQRTLPGDQGRRPRAPGRLRVQLEA